MQWTFILHTCVLSPPGSCWAVVPCGPCWWPPVEFLPWSSCSPCPSSLSPHLISSYTKETRKDARKVTEGFGFLFRIWLSIGLWRLLSPCQKSFSLLISKMTLWISTKYIFVIVPIRTWNYISLPFCNNKTFYIQLTPPEQFNDKW